MAVPLLVFLCLLSLEIVDGYDGCVSILPQSEEELVNLAKDSKLALPRGNIGDGKGENRIFPNITFSCDGSVVGWSIVAPHHIDGGGLRPILTTWSHSYQQKSKTTMCRVLNDIISKERKLYLYRTAIKPVNFTKQDIVGMWVRNRTHTKPRKTVFTPYMIYMNNSVAYYRYRNGAANEGKLPMDESDNLMPLLFLHVCIRSNPNYDECVRTRISRIGSQVDPKPECDPGIIPEPSSASTTLILALVITLTLSIILALLLVFALVCIGLVGRKRRGQQKETEKTVVVPVEISDARNEAQPYAEPISLSSRTTTPLPPPPHHPPPTPTTLGFDQPNYAVLTGPTPSPPPPYILGPGTDQPPQMRDLPSHEYESIGEQERKAALLRQNATETSMDSAGYSRLGPATNNNYHT